MQGDEVICCPTISKHLENLHPKYLAIEVFLCVLAGMELYMLIHIRFPVIRAVLWAICLMEKYIGTFSAWCYVQVILSVGSELLLATQVWIPDNQASVILHDATESVNFLKPRKCYLVI